MKRAAVFALLACTPLAGFEYITDPPSKWGGPPVGSGSGGNVDWRVNQAGTPDMDGGPSTGDGEHLILVDSLLQWENATGGNLDLEFVGLTVLGADTGDGANVMAWNEAGIGIPGAVALATYAFGASGTIIEGDVEFDGAVYTWDDSVILQNIALHELGHTIGFAHEEDSPAVMNAIAGGFQDLQPDDLAGAAALYGVGAGGDGVMGSAPPPPESPPSGSGGGGDEGAVADDDDDGKHGLKKYCVIATAAWGSPAVRQVEGLRAFRDRTVVSCGSGEASVATYGRTAAGAARVVGRSDVLRAVVRRGLAP
ncbi:MAG: matrixin family metalloprotease [Planctomycetes bacterium]|nr:matrixin family metalloprotease [Planctomycetota bacterium]